MCRCDLSWGRGGGLSHPYLACRRRSKPCGCSHLPWAERRNLAAGPMAFSTLSCIRVFPIESPVIIHLRILALPWGSTVQWHALLSSRLPHSGFCSLDFPVAPMNGIMQYVAIASSFSHLVTWRFTYFLAVVVFLWWRGTIPLYVQTAIGYRFFTLGLWE